ncbi:hypothetical protein HHX47_DHR1001732 [Lentinula edodes]|nr:hypothetical protein HHX47_DHR1001732 [Lentinula edodes]
MSLNISQRLCSMISKAIIKFCACKQCTQALLLRMKLKSSNDSPVSNSQLYTPSHRSFSSYTNANDYPQKKIVKPLAAFFVMNNRIYQSPDLYTVLSNRLLTSLYSIQSTLDSLRTHRPDYTPRTGFVWPIVDPSLAEDAGKKQEDTSTNEVGGMSEAPTKQDATASLGVPKRPQNNTLLMNAMHATAAHSSASLASLALAPTVESVLPDPAASLASRMSATPAPVVSRVATPKPIHQEPPPKAAPGGGKKKRKRTMVMASENA